MCGVLLTSCAHATTAPLLPAAQNALSASAPGASGYQQLYSFSGSARGSAPMSGLTPISGALYGTTTGGGQKTFGSIFVRGSSGSVRVIHSFKGGSDGATPNGTLLTLGGALYGTTEFGGAAGDGTVFRSSTTGSESIVHSFKGGNDGATPLLGGLVAIGGKLYGTTNAGGDHRCHVAQSTGCGVVFALTTDGTERVLHRFGGKPDGAAPSGPLVSDGTTLYGTTSLGGAHDSGTVYSIDTTGRERVLYSFKGYPDGAQPYGGVTLFDGTLYGTTSFGGAYSYSGTIFSLSTSGVEHVLHSFTGYPDGAIPYSSLTAVKGVLYGATAYGGNDGPRCTGNGIVGCGTLFSIDSSAHERVIYRFKGEPDGANPWMSPVFTKNALYGTTLTGGASGDGTIFRLSSLP
jgi:uncharacterized repeat protein (TIGR03803 family)